MQDLTTALALLLGHYIEVHLQHTGISSLRVGEYMQLTDIKPSHKRQIILPILLRLTTNSYHTIHTDERMRHYLANMLNSLGKWESMFAAKQETTEGGEQA